MLHMGNTMKKNTQVNIPFPQHMKCPIPTGPYQGPPSGNVWDLHWGQKLVFFKPAVHSGPQRRSMSKAEQCSITTLLSEVFQWKRPENWKSGHLNSHNPQGASLRPHSWDTEGIHVLVFRKKRKSTVRWLLPASYAIGRITVYSRWNVQQILIRLRAVLNGRQLKRKTHTKKFLKIVSGETLARKPVSLLNSRRAKPYKCL